MTAITWDAVGERHYKTGIDRAVLYLPGENGVPWNGFVSVEEKPSGGDLTPIYFDGVLIANTIGGEDYAATITAYTYPEEFEICDGSNEIQPGVLATLQPRQPFNLTYRTKIGNDVKGPDYGYEIHLLYNVTALPSTRSYVTLSESIDPLNFSWDISAVPVAVPGVKPTSHIIVDSIRTPISTIDDLEETLYGSDLLDPTFPSITDMLYILANGFIEEPLHEPL